MLLGDGHSSFTCWLKVVSSRVLACPDGGADVSRPGGHAGGWVAVGAAEVGPPDVAVAVGRGGRPVSLVPASSPRALRSWKASTMSVMPWASAPKPTHRISKVVERCG